VKQLASCEAVLSSSLKNQSILKARQNRSKKKQRQGYYEKIYRDIQPMLSSIERKALEIVTSHGASSWLTTLPLEEEYFVLNKQEFFDAIFMRYRWLMKRMLTKCSCQANFTIKHELSCHLGGSSFSAITIFVMLSPA